MKHVKYPEDIVASNDSFLLVYPSFTGEGCNKKIFTCIDIHVNSSDDCKFHCKKSKMVVVV
ncbi:hypothetical protein [Alkalihalobacillus sp. AL-G]|uniref:hypothetical protein n=1 Tax=Alkalihalobacillus sp. AL-G TaxID=2926399 RepID=UPI00272CE89E|nr:hypothetical protein [Alkalihalobacillus sp. AL-G]WLD91695.1 hypothetical protein MOJ78_11640 [Alkalihalobacillus sp. AL-G]